MDTPEPWGSRLIVENDATLIAKENVALWPNQNFVLTVVIIFGLGFATILQLVVVPLMIYCFDFSMHSEIVTAPALPTPSLDEPDDGEPTIAVAT